MKLRYYTDGSAHPNPGPGGYGIVIVNELDEIIDTISKQYDGPVTNNRMEMEAILYIMENFSQDCPVVYSDSSYCVNTFTQWIYSWKKNNWKNSSKKTPENFDLIKKYWDYLQEGRRIELRKIKGHSDDKFNDIADKLAKGGTYEQ